VFEGTRAVGVEYEHKGEVKRAGAREEVILSAGALASPKLLKLSGLGPREELERFGIPVVHDSPGVGENLQEQPVSSFGYQSKVPTLNKPRPRDIAKGLVTFLKDGSGPLSITVYHVQAIHRLHPDSQSPDIQTAFCAFFPGKHVEPDGSMKIGTDSDWACMLATTLAHPRGRGRIRLRSASPADPPIIEHQLFANADDVSDLLAGIEEGRRIMAEPALTDLVGEMIGAERDCRSRADWEQWLRKNATYGIHPVGTCKMGTDDLAVVDPELKAQGVTGLRVIDASVMPTETTGNTNAASMMIGEKGADLVLNRG
jgi:choline dehydrogenase